MAITDYDSNAANNTTVNGVNIAEGCSPAGINNAIREVMADLAGVVDLFYPVGSTIMSTSSANPGLRFPGTTWAQVAEGRAIVGVGTSDTADAFDWSVGQKRGLETHTLTESEMPSHLHGNGSLSIGVAGAHTHGLEVFYVPGVDTPYRVSGSESGGSPTIQGNSIQAAGDHTHALNGAMSSAGGDGAHNNLQPSQAFYIWERTA